MQDAGCRMQDAGPPMEWRRPPAAQQQCDRAECRVPSAASPRSRLPRSHEDSTTPLKGKSCATITMCTIDREPGKVQASLASPFSVLAPCALRSPAGGQRVPPASFETGEHVRERGGRAACDVALGRDRRYPPSRFLRAEGRAPTPPWRDVVHLGCPQCRTWQLW
eukprot:scaffold22126_cov70-Phaeocystis_antarctica.AAC.6